MHTLDLTNLSGGGKLALNSVVTYQVDTSPTVPGQPSGSTTTSGDA
jgi:hypothetical protein